MAEPTNTPTPRMPMAEVMELWWRIHAETGTRIIAVIRMGERQGDDGGTIIHNASEWEALRARLEGEGE